MEINTLSLENHDFSAKTKVFIVDFDNVGSSRDLIHALAKINMLKYISMKEKAFLNKKEVSKEGFESMILFLSSYAKARDMNSKLQDLFTIVDERNSESEYKGVLQFTERLEEFINYTTELTDFGPYYEYFSVNKEQLKVMDVDWVRHMLMISSSRGIMQTGLTIPSKSVACIRLDDLYTITSDYCTESGEFENFIQPLGRAMTQLAGRLARTNKEGNKILRKNNETYQKGDLSTRQPVESNRVLILFKATEAQSGDRIDFFKCINLIEKIPSIKICEKIYYCSFKTHRGNSKSLLEDDPSYNLEANQRYVSRIEKIGKRDLVYEICSHIDIIDSAKMQSPSKIGIIEAFKTAKQSVESQLKTEENEVEKTRLREKIETLENVENVENPPDELFELIYENEISPKVLKTVDKIMSYGIPREYLSINWANTRAIISGLSNKSLFNELDAIKREANSSEMGFLQFFEDVYYPRKIEKSNSKGKISLRINVAVSRGIALPYLQKVTDTFGEGQDLRFREIIKKKLKKDFA